MANESISGKNDLMIAHFPTLLLCIGYIVFWIELYFFDTSSGLTSSLASLLFLAIMCLYLSRNRHKLDIKNSFQEMISSYQSFDKFVIIFTIILSLGLLIVAIHAAGLPPHLMQEYDALNYHYTLARQHLITQSFSHILWSSADLFMFPIQFALAPYWFVTELPNKIPQLLFLIGFILISINLIRLHNRKAIVSYLGVMAIFGSHAFGIQMGTAMLDIVICYLLLAAIDSFRRGRWLLSSIEFAFFFWSKSFIPYQSIVIIIMFSFVVYILKKFGDYKCKWDFLYSVNVKDEILFSAKYKNWVISFLILSIFIAGPFLSKSLYYSGTPTFPFGVGNLIINDQIDKNSESWRSLLKAADNHLGARNAYGQGRSAYHFIKHFWLIAVPDKGVNNKFDYPLGLVYLLFFGPFLFWFIKSFRNKEIPILPWLAVLFWISWWFGSQQSRFLYIPIALIFISVILTLKEPSRVLLTLLLVALGLNFLSVLRANKNDWGLSREKVLRKKDLQIVQISRKYLSDGQKNPVRMYNHEVAFAQFPVEIMKENLPFVIKTY